MARNDEGEFELILGNRQLVSVFLIVVILLGAFFSMGYLVGRSSSPVLSADNGSRGEKPIVVDGTSRQPVETGASGTPAPARQAPPAIEKPSPIQPAAPAPEVKREEPKTEAPIREKPPATPSSEEPRAGTTFLQVVATTRPDAEIIAESLAKKGFRTTVAPGPNSAIFRVIVGPVSNAADLAETRVRLEAVGFKPIVRRY